MKAYRNQVMRDSYKSLYGKIAQKFRGQQALLEFGRRQEKSKIDINKWLIESEAKETRREFRREDEDKYKAEVYKEVAKGYGARRPVTLESILARMQLEPSLFEMIGRWEGVIELGGAGALKYYEQIPDDKPGKEKWWTKMVDPAIASWMKTRMHAG